MNPTLIINDELKSLLPPLSDAEYAGLEADILNDGRCNVPLTVWGDFLVDGHHRYSICQKHQIPFTVDQREFDSLDDAKIWIAQNQMHRRNSNRFHRGEVILKLKVSVTALAKERQRCGPGGILLPQNSAEATETRQVLAKLANMSHDTLRRIEFIIEHADEETKVKLRQDEAGISINKVYEDLKAKLNQATATAAKSATTTTVTETTAQTESSRETAHAAQTGTTDSQTATSTDCNADSTTTAQAASADDGKPTEPLRRPSDSDFVETVTLTHIPANDPERLIACLFDLFSFKYREQLIVDLLDQMKIDDGEQVVQRIVAGLTKRFSG